MAGFHLDDYLGDTDFFGTLAEDVRRGLTQKQKQLSPKYFYDAAGSELFERITELPEYYPMRTEASILEAVGPRLMAEFAPSEIVEIGSGSSTKTRILLDSQPRDASVTNYVAFDVSAGIIRSAAETLNQRYPELRVHGIVGDFERHLGRVPACTSGRRLVLFLGSTIGNLYREERTQLLRSMAGLLGPEDYLLVGMDLVKDVETLQRAYDDSAGVTAAFNRNVLRVINTQLHANFNVDAYQHLAIFNDADARIEMHLWPETEQVVRIKDIDLTVTVSPEETIWTESSHKFQRETAEEMFAAAELTLHGWFTDERDYFALALVGCGDGGAVEG